MLFAGVFAAGALCVVLSDLYRLAVYSNFERMDHSDLAKHLSLDGVLPEDGDVTPFVYGPAIVSCPIYDDTQHCRVMRQAPR